tara:strand:+ start:75 stop:338 length:264 start_codon:yes stop_codon:yes gene_type:complete
MEELMEKYKFKQSQFEELSFDDEKILYGRLKMLEDLALYIDQLRESYTRHLVVNGAQDCETETDLKERWADKKTETIEDDLLHTKVI